MRRIFLILFLLSTGQAISQSQFLKTLKVGDSIYMSTGNAYINMNQFYRNGIPLLDSLNANNLKAGKVQLSRLPDSLFKLSNFDTSAVAMQNQINTYTKFQYFGNEVFLQDYTLLHIGDPGSFPFNGIHSEFGDILFTAEAFRYITASENYIMRLDSIDGLTLSYGTFHGDGRNLLYLNASNIQLGTIMMDRMSDSVLNKYRSDTLHGDYNIMGNLVLGNLTATDILAGGTVFGSFSGDGSNIENINLANVSGTLDTARLSPMVYKTNNLDTSKVLFTNRNTPKTITGAWSFSNVITFAVSPVFSALLNAGNGISTTVLTVTGWFNNTKEIPTIKKKLANQGAYLHVRHNESNWRNLYAANIIYFDDSTSRKLLPGYNASAGMTVPTVVAINDTAVEIFVSGNSLNIGHNPNCAGCTDNDSVYVTLKVLNP